MFEVHNVKSRTSLTFHHSMSVWVEDLDLGWAVLQEEVTKVKKLDQATESLKLDSRVVKHLLPGCFRRKDSSICFYLSTSILSWM